MTSINPLQTALHNRYAQLGDSMQSATQAVRADADVLHRLGLSSGLLQNLRQDFGAVANGSNSERALDNLLSGLQQFSGSTAKLAKGRPADQKFPTSFRSVDLVKGEDGKPVRMAKEWPAGQEVPAGHQFKDLVKGEDGEPVRMAKEWPAGQEVPAGHRFKDIVQGEDGKPKEFKSSDTQPSKLADSNASVQSYTDALASNISEFLNAEAVGGDFGQAFVALRSQLQEFFNNPPLDSNPASLRDALRNSIRSYVTEGQSQ